MTPESLQILIALIIKILTLLGLFIYILFALVVVRQEQLMENVLEDQFEPVIRLMTVVHLIASIGIFFLAIFLL